MICLNIVVEGQTEETFVRDVLAPYWGAREIFARARCVETGRKKGKIFRGGIKHYQKAKFDILTWMKQEPNAWFTTMFDLYGLPGNFPGMDQGRHYVNPYEKVKMLEDAFAADIGRPRFIPYLQLHEFEALLFADIKWLGKYYLEKSREIERLQKLVDCFETPEYINDGFDTAPSKRISKEIPEYLDDKVLVGPGVANAIGLEILRDKCSHFEDRIKKIEQIGHFKHGRQI